MNTLLNPFRVALVLPGLILSAFLYFLFFAEVTESRPQTVVSIEGIAILSSFFLTASIILAGLFRPREAGIALCILTLPIAALFRFFWFYDILFGTVLLLGIMYLRANSSKSIPIS